MITFIASIFVFSLVILVHEFGHYKVAKSVGIRVEEFAIGMGPLIYKKEKNDTIYSIRLLPIGGYVKMEGEEEDVNTTNSYSNKTVWQRFKVIAAGPLMNFVLALIIYIIIAAIFGISGGTIDTILEESELYKAGVRSGDKIIKLNNENVYIWEEIVYGITEDQEKPYSVTVQRGNESLKYDVNQYYRYLIGIQPLSEDNGNAAIIATSDNNLPAYKAGIRSGDKIIKLNNTDINDYNQLRDMINVNGDALLNITVERDGQMLSFDMTPQREFNLGFNTKQEKSVVTALVYSVYKTGYYIKLMFEFIGMLFTGKLGSDAVGGPVQVISMIGESAKLGIYPLLDLLAFISVNLGFMNLLPIPALDGSKLVFLIIEKVRGKKIPIEKEGFVHFIGFVLLITLMIFITYKDIVRLIL